MILLSQSEGGFFMSDPEFPISSLISSRCKELDLRPVELVRRCGYQNRLLKKSIIADGEDIE